MRVFTVRFCKLSPEAIAPRKATEGSAGFDLFASAHACLGPLSGGVEENSIGGSWVEVVAEPEMVRTGIAVEIPLGFEGQVRARSGLAVHHRVVLLHGVATIDSDYRGELVVPLINLGSEKYFISPGDRIAQLIIAPIANPTMLEVEELPSSARGEGGFGSTGR